MRLHGLAVLAFLFALGGLGTVHVPRGWRQRRNHFSGLSLIAFAVALTVSGYALYYWVDELARVWVGGVHAVLGLLLAAVFAWHWRGRYPASPHR